MALMLLAFALILRMAVPTGWMPASDGSFAIIPCPATAPVPEVHSGHHGASAHASHDPGKHDGKSEQAKQDCAFAPLGSALGGPAELASIAPPALAPAFPIFTFAAVSIGHGLAAPPPPSTGPPLLS